MTVIYIQRFAYSFKMGGIHKVYLFTLVALFLNTQILLISAIQIKNNLKTEEVVVMNKHSQDLGVATSIGGHDLATDEKMGLNVDTIMDYGPPGANPGHDPVSPPPNRVSRKFV
ncbi:hypothetical protein ACP275_10G151000 [Erythranthe tilingii]